MCQGIPRPVLAVAAGRLRVDIDGRPTWVAAGDALSDVTVGEHVVVYAGVALDRVSPDEAAEQLRFMRELEELFPATEDGA